MPAAQSPPTALTRRQALGLFGLAAGAVSLIRLGRRTAAWAGSCVETKPATEGPFWIDEGLQRSDITIDPSDGTARPGVPLTLRLNILRTDDGCAPAPGVQVDVWHCDADGIYSDQSANGTAGKKFLRGYQLTDGGGVARFTTIYPGWYPGRTIHIHYRVRALVDGAPTFDFASQVYFDDAISDQVLAQAPYDARGARHTTNANDTIYDGALLTLTADGSGGYTGAFDVGLSGLPASTGTCSDLASCDAAVTAALPDAATAANRKSRKVARRLARLSSRASTALDRAALSSGNRVRRQNEKARAALSKLVGVATAADGAGTLGAPLATLTQAVSALLALIPPA